MKKIYTLIASGLMATTMIAQPFFTPTSYIGAFPITDNTPATDWTAGWANFDPESTVYAAPTVTVNTNITTNTIWTSSNVYQLIGNIAVTSGAVLTIQPGTVIKGDLATKSCLIITKGSKIIAQGTSSMPIVFTSNEAIGSRDMGDWGGLIILGNGIINTPGTNVACTGCGTNPNVNQIEGFAAYDAVQLYGGTNNADSSGVLSYVRIEFPGVALSSLSNSEINGLTLGGVGSKTKIDHVQVTMSGDDAFEWFGGAVNAKHIIAYRTFDDDLDTDFGYVGNVQFGLVVRDPNLADASKVESFESDNFNPGTGRTPLTQPIFSNITVVGPTRDGLTTPGSNLFLCAAQIRRNSATSIFNSIITGWPTGLQVAGSSTQDNFTTNDSAVFGNNWIIGSTKAIDVSASTSPLSFYQTFFGTDNNDSTKTNTNVNWVNPFPATLILTPDFRLNGGTPAAIAASFTDPKFNGITTGINTTDFVNSIVLYPNPANDFISINVSGTSDVKINIYDVTGKLISSPINETSNQTNSVYKLDIKTLPSGIYFASVETNNTSKTLKFVVAK